MMKLSGRTQLTGTPAAIRHDVWQVCGPAAEPSEMPLACLFTDSQSARPGHRLYLTRQGAAGPGPTVLLPDDLAHITVGDIISVAGDGSRIAVLWKSTATHNSVLLTEQCDNYCLMCSQPPKTRDDAWLFERAKRIVSLLPLGAEGIGLTGGEPTLNEDAFIGLLEHCRDVAPWLRLHLLTNGRRFADLRFAERYAAIEFRDIMAGIPLYAPEPHLHDYVVQADGAFEETVHGILNLSALGRAVEIRIVVQLLTVPVLAELAEFIARNLPFVDQVALMGLEMTGLARPNSAEVWIDPLDYQEQLHEAASILTDAHIHTKIYNHQLCVLDERLWPLAVRSISDWKNDYLDVCRECAVRDLCGGVFTTSGTRLSPHLHPLRRRPDWVRAPLAAVPSGGPGGPG